MSRIGDGRPRYRRLRDQLAAEIARNVWHPGEPIPIEAALAREYDVSVGTVRKALDLLESEGLVERVQGSGNFVRRPNFETAFVRFIHYFGSANDQRMPQSRILDQAALDGPGEVTLALQLGDGARVIRLRRLRTLDGLRVLSEEVWLAEARFAALLTAKIESRLLYPLYESLCGEVVAHVEETITIGSAGESDAELLGLVEGTPVVLIERIAFGYDNRPMELRRSRGPAADFRCKVDIR